MKALRAPSNRPFNIQFPYVRLILMQGSQIAWCPLRSLNSSATVRVLEPDQTLFTRRLSVVLTSTYLPKNQEGQIRIYLSRNQAVRPEASRVVQRDTYGGARGNSNDVCHTARLCHARGPRTPALLSSPQ